MVGILLDKAREESHGVGMTMLVEGTDSLLKSGHAFDITLGRLQAFLEPGCGEKTEHHSQRECNGRSCNRSMITDDPVGEPFAARWIDGVAEWVATQERMEVIGECLGVRITILGIEPETALDYRVQAVGNVGVETPYVGGQA